MQIISADYIYINGEYKKKYSVAFNEKIEAVGDFDSLKNIYPKAEVINCGENSVLYAGFINTHTHLEFSANKNRLKYGSFLPWLYSVIENRDELMNSCDEDIIDNAIDEMLKSGVTTFGAISSLGLDLQACVKAPQRVVFFNELIGSNPQSVDALYQDFLQRFEASSLHKESLVTPAVAIHSPYSVHPIVVKKGIALAKSKNVPLTAHLLESQAEKEWLDNSTGEFKKFFKNLLNQDKSVTTVDEFISAFDEYPTLFSHCVEVNKNNRKELKDNGHFVAHCPRSNRLLGCNRFEIENFIKEDIPFSVATDGLSSNYSLNIFDELRGALMLHHLGDINLLAKKLIESVTSKAGEALGLECGEIKKGYFADFAVIELAENPTNIEDIALWTILHTKEIKQVYIGGKKYV
jgi:cytosine/adenosine deaminase-related metal-dependent hydrolase